MALINLTQNAPKQLIADFAIRHRSNPEHIKVKFYQINVKRTGIILFDAKENIVLENFQINNRGSFIYVESLKEKIVF